MPIYEYRCTDCGFEKEYLQKISDPLLTQCPSCGKATFVKKVTAAGFQLKGTGWYVTDFRNSGATTTPAPSAKSEAGADAAKAGGAAAAGADASAGEGKSDSTAAAKADAPATGGAKTEAGASGGSKDQGSS